MSHEVIVSMSLVVKSNTSVEDLKELAKLFNEIADNDDLNIIELFEDASVTL
jgi:hypothetical protein